jgi:diguanylate cyclase (GGDEF)-like protein/PAS domain S-box-containing protein
VHREDDGSELHLSLSISPIRSTDGEVIGAAIIARDLTERMALQRSLAEDHERLSEAQEIARMGSFELELETLTTSRSPEFDRILGLGPDDTDDEIIARIHPEDRHDILRELQRVIDGVPVIERTHRIVLPDGTQRWVRSRSRNTHRGGRPVVTGTVLDVTEQHRAEVALARQATHDALTGLLNRTGLHAELSRALATDPEHRVAVAIVDLDRFKLINDTLGHRVGDETLVAVATRLRQRLLPDDVIARMGGDEFVLLRAGLDDDLGSAAVLAEQALEALTCAPLQVGPRRFELTGSVGVTLSAPVDSAESLLSDADAAMYLAKHHGGTKVAVFDEAARERANRRLEIEAALVGAARRGELELHHQPVVTLRDEVVNGFEALLRWRHPTLGVVGPDEFVPIAETSGLILPIGRWVIDAALTQLAAWRARPGAPEDLWVAVNLSAAQLGEDGFVDWFGARLAASGVPSHCVHLEVTERALVDHVEHAVDTLAELRRMGVLVSVDDFGTGYSSLSYLDRLPVDVLKVDRSFVQRLGPSSRETAVVRSIVALARTLELQVVVEGVETDEQLSIVRTLGCDFAQGFHWSAALEPDDAGALVGRPLGAR